MSNMFAVTGVTSKGGDAAWMIILAFMLIASLLIGGSLIAAHVNRAEENCLKVKKLRVVQVMAIVLVAGFAVRLLIGCLIRGFRGNMGVNYEIVGYNELWNTVDSVLYNGFSYDFDRTVYPLGLYLLSLFATPLRLFGGWSIDSVTAQLMLKLPMILCDCAVAALLFFAGRRYANSYVGLILCGLYMFCPIFFLGSAVSLTVFPLLALTLALTLYFMASKNNLGVIICFALALLTSKDAVYFLIPVVVYIVCNYVKGIKRYRGDKNSENKKYLVKIPCYIAAAMVGMYLVMVPMISKVYFANPFTALYELWIRPFSHFNYFGFNSLSIYNIFMKNGVSVSTSFPSIWLSLAFFAIIAAMVLMVYLTRRNRANLVLLASYTAVTLSVYLLDFGQLSLLPALAILLLSFIFIKDKRILSVFSLLALFVFLNDFSVLVGAGYLSNAAKGLFSQNAYDGSLLLNDTTFGTVMSIFCSAGAILTHVYMTFVVLDITVSFNRRPFTGLGGNFGENLKKWFIIGNKEN